MSGHWNPTFAADAGPKYRAILDALADDIRCGRLAPGTRLPPQRTLARQFEVDLTTITRAFNEARRIGLIEATAGRGSFVRAIRPRRSKTASPAEAGMDFSMNMPPQPPAARLAERLVETQTRLAASPGFLARLQYQDSAGPRADRAVAAAWLGRRLGSPGQQRVVIAAGAQAGLAAILATLLGPGDGLCVPALTYPGLRLIAERRRVRLLPVECDAHGILPEALAECCRRDAPRAFYLVPTIDNPTTATIPAARRAAIIAVAREAGIAIVEDDAYGPLPEQPPETFAALAPEIVWHVATLSKCVTPALRVAFVVAPTGADAARLTAELRVISLMVSPLNSAIAASWIEDGSLDAVVDAIRAENHARQSIAARVLRGMDVAADRAGPHLWLALPPAWDRARLDAHARQLGLSVVASDAFAVGPSPEAIRVALGAAPDHETLQQGLNLLAMLLAHPPGAVSTIV